ncbi:MAG: hypothetical protein KAZ95_01075 [Rhodoluna sp.]|jgi:hypothetical protein|nr:hypothetical protein [Rhodoluna sp.]
MHIEDIFEDLEAQFAAANQTRVRDSITSGARAIEVNTASMVPKELIAPILGSDFLAGLDSVSPIWHIFPMRSVTKVLFHAETEQNLPKLRNFAIDFIGFLNSIPTPCSIRWRIAGSDSFIRVGQLHTVTGSLLFIYLKDIKRPIAVPIQALQMLSIESVDNLNGDF